MLWWEIVLLGSGVTNAGGRDERKGDGERKESEAASMFIPPCRDANTN